jgi:hypothetical protein
MFKKNGKHRACRSSSNPQASVRAADAIAFN